ncbi:MAG: V-type ATP synthase subunit D [Oscillospiraceae bacterium]
MANAMPVPTKGNLMKMRRSLAQAKLGYYLMDRKRNILIREMMTMTDTAKSLRGSIEETYRKAYLSLQKANIALGICDKIAESMPVENGLSLSAKSVMGVDIPIVILDEKPLKLNYGITETNSDFDEAYRCFDEVKKKTAVLAEMENSIYRLAMGIKKTGKRANALKNIMIPHFEESIKYITENLEEKDREEFSRQKIIKSMKIAE